MEISGLNDAPNILVVDDDPELRDLIGRFLHKHGFRVRGARDGVEMREAMERARFDLIVLDLMLPGEDGLSLCRALRSASRIPIIMLTAAGDDTDRILGLEMGADDYIAKPFNPRELLARIKAVLRRAGDAPEAGAAAKSLRFAGWHLDLVRRELLSPEGAVTELTAGEFDLLTVFVEHPQRVLGRDLLLDLTRGRMAAPYDRSIDVQVSRLRRKLDRDAQQTLIKTVRSAGYVFTALVEPA